MEYRRTGDFGAVMVLLGHKSLKYMLLYAQLSEMYGGNREYIGKDAHTPTGSNAVDRGRLRLCYDR
jgi:hypothetical protein